jgi:hypothetical protein
MSVPKRLTRRQLVDFLRDEGFPVTLHAINKFCSPARNEGPPVAAYWGRLELYEPAAAVEWAEKRLKLVAA